MKYKLHSKDFEIWKQDLYILPTVRVFIDNRMYLDRNFSIEFHFLMLHARLLFMEE